MKRYLPILIVGFLLSPMSALGGNATLDETAATVHEMWTEWMEKPPLEIDSLEDWEPQLIAGRWSATGIAEGTEELRICIRFDEDGTWTASEPWPKFESAQWYINKDMILLFYGPLLPDDSPATFITAVVFKDGNPYLIAADDDSGVIQLRRTEQPGGDNPD